jgi:hypothetical protein
MALDYPNTRSLEPVGWPVRSDLLALDSVTAETTAAGELFTRRDPARVHGICDEYRAAATIDVEHDRADKEASKRIACPMLHLRAEGGRLDASMGSW